MFGGEKPISIVLYFYVYICNANFKHIYCVYIYILFLHNANLPYFVQPLPTFKVMVHGDDKGLVLPPYVAGIQVGSLWQFFMEAENNWLVVSNIFYFHPLLGEDSHFD